MSNPKKTKDKNNHETDTGPEQEGGTEQQRNQVDQAPEEHPRETGGMQNPTDLASEGSLSESQSPTQGEMDSDTPDESQESLSSQVLSVLRTTSSTADTLPTPGHPQVAKLELLEEVQEPKEIREFYQEEPLHVSSKEDKYDRHLKLKGKLDLLRKRLGVIKNHEKFYCGGGPSRDTQADENVKKHIDASEFRKKFLLNYNVDPANEPDMRRNHRDEEDPDRTRRPSSDRASEPSTRAYRDSKSKRPPQRKPSH